MTNNGHTRAVLYARVSSDDTGNNGSNLQSQLGMCREYAEQQGYKVIEELTEDERGASGANHNLPQLSQAMEMARAGAYEVFVVRELDRLARDMRKQFNIEDALKAEDVKIDYVLGRYGDDWRGEFLKNIEAAVAQAERDQIRERTRRGRRASVEKGNVTCCGRPPFGYREAIVDGKRSLVMEPEEAEVIRTIYRLYVEGNGEGEAFGFRSIARYLTERQLPSPADRGNVIRGKTMTKYGFWADAVVKHMLKSPAYKGEWQYSKHSDEPISVEVPAIVSREKWETTQSIVQMNRKVRKYSGDYDFLLKGVASCSLCGTPARVLNKRGEKRQDHYYKHRKPTGHPNNNGSRCAGYGYYRAEDVDTLVWKYVERVLSDPDSLAGAFKTYRAQLKSGDSPTRDKLEQVQKLAANTKRKLARLLDVYLDGTITQEQYADRKKPLDIALERHAEQVAALSQELEQSHQLEGHMQSMTEFAQSAARAVQQPAKANQKREVIRRLGLRVELGRAGNSKYADAVFCFPGISNAKQYAT